MVPTMIIAMPVTTTAPASDATGSPVLFWSVAFLRGLPLFRVAGLPCARWSG